MIAPRRACGLGSSDTGTDGTSGGLAVHCHHSPNRYSPGLLPPFLGRPGRGAAPLWLACSPSGHGLGELLDGRGTGAGWDAPPRAVALEPPVSPVPVYSVRSGGTLDTRAAAREGCRLRDPPGRPGAQATPYPALNGPRGPPDTAGLTAPGGPGGSKRPRPDPVTGPAARGGPRTASRGPTRPGRPPGRAIGRQRRIPRWRRRFLDPGPAWDPPSPRPGAPKPWRGGSPRTRPPDAVEATSPRSPGDRDGPGASFDDAPACGAGSRSSTLGAAPSSRRIRSVAPSRRPGRPALRNRLAAGRRRGQAADGPPVRSGSRPRWIAR